MLLTLLGLFIIKGISMKHVYFFKERAIESGRNDKLIDLIIDYNYMISFVTSKAGINHYLYYAINTIPKEKFTGHITDTMDTEQLYALVKEMCETVFKELEKEGLDDLLFK